MIFEEAPISGVFRVRPERHGDDRGYFARTFCRQEFAAHGLAVDWPQHNTSFSAQRGTVRGLHWQREPHAEAKVVRCTAGAIFDVVVDLRPDSPTRGAAFSLELSAATGDALYVPEGFLHGFQTLCDETEVSYLMSTPYAPEAAGGFAFDDPAFGIEWPLPVSVISERDRALPRWKTEP